MLNYEDAVGAVEKAKLGKVDDVPRGGSLVIVSEHTIERPFFALVPRDLN